MATFTREKESNIPCALLSRNHPRQNTHTKLYCTSIAIDTCNCTSCASEKVQVVYTSVCPPVIAVIYLYFWGSNNSIYFLFLISNRGGKERGKQIFEFLKKNPNKMIVVCSHMFSDRIGNGQLDRRESIIL